VALPSYSGVEPLVTVTSTPSQALALPVYFTLYVHVAAVLPPIGAPADESPGNKFEIAQVTDPGDPGPTVTVPAVKVFAPLDPLLLNRPKVAPPTRVPTAPSVAAIAPPSASRFLSDGFNSYSPRYTIFADIGIELR
jgi:hypothetical protein